MTTYKCEVTLSDNHGSGLSTTLSADSLEELANRKDNFISINGKGYATCKFSNIIVIEKKEIPNTSQTIEL